MVASLNALHRFPVKGLSPEPVDEALLEAGAYFPDDRIYAVENGSSGYDPAAPRHLPKTKFLTLMRQEGLARLRTRFNTQTGRLAIHLDDRAMCEADLATARGRAEVEAILADFLGGSARGSLKILKSGGNHRFTDSRDGFVSLINLASVESVATAIGRPVDPLRFRANLAIGGLPAWAEQAWIGRHIGIGSAVLSITVPTDRCAATEVDPMSGNRDLAVMKTLVGAFGHNLCGVYASVVKGGVVRAGDTIRLIADGPAGGDETPPS